MNRVRTSYRTTQDVTVYREQEEGYAQIPHTVQAGKTIFLAVADHETRKVGGVLVDVVLFTIDTEGWYWMPRVDFLGSTEKYDVKTQTGIPFQH